MFSQASEVRVTLYKRTDRFATQFTRRICLFHLGLPRLPFSSSLVKLTAFGSDFLHNPRQPQRADGLSQQSSCSFKFVPKKIANGKSTGPRSGACSVSDPGLLAKLTHPYLPLPHSPSSASPQALTEWSLGPGETKMAPDNGAVVNNVQLQIECAKILQERSLVFQNSGLLTSGSFNWTKRLKSVYKPHSMTSKWSCTGWRVFIKVQVGCNGLSLQGNFRANETTEQ